MTKLPDGTISLALPPGVARWTLSGRLSVDEVWSFDWWTSPGAGVASAAAWQSTVAAYEAVCRAAGLYTQLQQCLPAAGSVTDLKGIYYRVSQTATFVGQQVVSPAVAGLNGVNNPYQQCLCITLLTDIPGRSTRGRLYVPAPGLALSTARLFTPSVVASIAAALKTVLGAGNTDGQYGPPVVVSRTATIATRITSLRWDLRPDIQRRRANRQSDGGRTLLAL